MPSSSSSPSVLALRQSSPRVRWSLPVPLRRGGFTSMWPQHQRFDLVTDLSQMSSFGAPEDPSDHPADLLGYADYQLEPELPTPRRQGAGRAVFHDGHYLKGVGRTPLALNWRCAADLVHASGHLPASAALRELVVSRYLRAKGLGEAIVPCEGLLLRPMAKRFAARWTAAYGGELPASDTTLQAISVKPGDFARWSNIHWLAQHTATLSSAMIDLGTAMLHFCERRERELRLEDCTPSTIAAGLDAAFARGWDNFTAFVRAGVYWGSFHNNFSLDGRFLDLEVPLILGEGLCAKIVNSRGAELDFEYARLGHVVGWELGFYRRQVFNALRAIQLRLAEIARMSSAPLPREFAAQLNEALHQRFGADHLLRSRARFVEAVRELHVEIGASEGLAAEVAAAIDLEESTSRVAPVPARDSGLRLARIEPGMRSYVGIIGDAPGPRCAQAAHERALLGELFAELDVTRDAERYLERARAWMDILEREVRPRPGAHSPAA